MSDTPRTLARWKLEWETHTKSRGRSSPVHGMCDFAEELERENAELRAKLESERDKYLKLSEAYEGCDVELKEANRDVIVLCLRLCMEPNDSHSPDTADVLNRWRKVWEAVAAGMTIDAAMQEGK